MAPVRMRERRLVTSSATGDLSIFQRVSGRAPWKSRSDVAIRIRPQLERADAIDLSSQAFGYRRQRLRRN